MVSQNKKELIVSAIENGTVIDHIHCDAVTQVIRILGLDKHDDEVLIGMNLDSKKYIKKGVVKVRNKFFEKADLNKIALVSPSATLIVIKNYEVVEKIQVEIPETIEKIAKCINPNCITNNEVIETKFRILAKDPIKMQCHYCEKTMTNIRFTE